MNTHSVNNIPNPPPPWPDDSAPQDADVPTDFDDLNIPLPAASTATQSASTQAPAEFSYYSSVKARRCQRLTLSEILKKQSEIPARVRRLMEAGEWEKADALKKKAPAWTPHATFRDRRITEEARPNGYVCLDIDHVPNPHAVQKEIFDLPYVELADLSIRGEGVYVLIRLAEIPADADAFSALYPRIVAKLSDDMPEVAPYIDRTTRDLTRLRFISCLEYLHRTNPVALAIEDLPDLPQSQQQGWSHQPATIQTGAGPTMAEAHKAATEHRQRQQARKNLARQVDDQQQYTNDPEWTLYLVRDALAAVPASAFDDPARYNDWCLKIGGSLYGAELAGEIPSGTGLKLWDDYSAGGGKYTQGDCAKRWNGFNGKAKIGTFFKLFQDEFGWNRPRKPADTRQRTSGHIPKREVQSPQHLAEANSASSVSVVDMLDSVEQSAPEDLMAYPWPGGFVDLCAGYIEDNHYSPMQHNAMSALTLIFSILQHKAQLNLGGNVTYPQIYGLTIAPPQVYRKTSALYAVRKLLVEAGLKGIILPSDFTAEGIRDVIIDMAGEDGMSEAGGLSLIDDAAKMLFGDTKHMDTLRSFLLQASQGGQIDVARVSRGGRLKASKVRFSLLANTTPESFFNECDISAFNDGLFTRFVCAYTDGTDNWEAPALSDFDDSKRRYEIVGILQKLAEKVATIETPQTWAMPPLYFEYVRDENARMRALIKKGESSDWHAGNWGRALARTGILGINIAASDWAMGNGEWLKVSEDATVKAIGLSNHYAQVADLVHKDFVTMKPSSGRQQALLTVIRNACAKSKDGWITLRELKRSKRRSFKPVEVERLIEQLHDRNAITIVKGKNWIRISAGVSDLPVR